jgi:hypothetical protein
VVQVNTDSTKFGSWIEEEARFRERYYRFEPYPGGSGARKTLKKAMDYIKIHTVGAHGCDGYFGKLPEGNSFTKLWNDPAFVIHWDPRNNPTYQDANHEVHAYPFFGITSGQKKKHITISNLCLDKGYLWVAATIVHEMAHVNGAPVWDTSAEEALPPCGYKKYYTEGLKG